MDAIKKKYIMDENNEKVAVQIDIETYQKVEDLPENYALVQLMKEDDDERLEVREAKEYYKKLPKKSKIIYSKKLLRELALVPSVSRTHIKNLFLKSL